MFSIIDLRHCNYSRKRTQAEIARSGAWNDVAVKYAWRNYASAAPSRLTRHAKQRLHEKQQELHFLNEKQRGAALLSARIAQSSSARVLRARVLSAFLIVLECSELECPGAFLVCG